MVMFALLVSFRTRDGSCTFINIKWNMYSIDKCIATEKEEKNMPRLTSVTRKKSNTFSSILVSLFKGHTSIRWIQISMGKAYQSNFPAPSIELNQTEIDHVKGYFTPSFLWPMKEWQADSIVLIDWHYLESQTSATIQRNYVINKL